MEQYCKHLPLVSLAIILFNWNTIGPHQVGACGIIAIKRCRHTEVVLKINYGFNNIFFLLLSNENYYVVVYGKHAINVCNLLWFLLFWAYSG